MTQPTDSSALEIITFEAGSPAPAFLRFKLPSGAVGLSEICHANMREVIPRIANIFSQYSQKQGGVTELLATSAMDQSMDEISSVAVSALASALTDGIARAAGRTLRDELLTKGAPPAAAADRAELCVRVRWQEQSLSAFKAEVSQLQQRQIKHILLEYDRAELGKSASAALEHAAAEFATVYIRFSQKLDMSRAITVAADLQRLGAARLDEPFVTGTHMDSLRVLQENVQLRVGAGAELFHIDHFRQILWQRVADTVLLDLSFCGGVGSAYDIASEVLSGAASCGMYCTGGLVSLAATAHLCAALGLDTPIVCDLPETAPYFDECAVSIADGAVLIDSRASGHGVTLDKSYVRAHGRVWSP